MISLIALALTGTLGAQARGTPSWVEAFRKTCPPVKAEARSWVARHRTAPCVQRSAAPGAFVDDTTRDDTAIGAKLRPWLKFMDEANSRIQRGQYEYAYQLVAQQELQQPWSRRDDVFLSSTCDILTGRFARAYKLLSEATSRGWSMNDESYLNLSIVCAARGQVFPGQGEFILERLAAGNGVFLHLADWPRFSSTPPRNPRDVMVESGLAMGLREGSEMFGYLELVLKWDPSNKIAAHEAIRGYGYKGRYSDLRRIATQMLRRTTVKSEREYYTAELKKVEGLPDKKPEVRKNPFDNAGPPPP